MTSFDCFGPLLKVRNLYQDPGLWSPGSGEREGYTWSNWAYSLSFSKSSTIQDEQKSAASQIRDRPASAISLSWSTNPFSRSSSKLLSILLAALLPLSKLQVFYGSHRSFVYLTFPFPFPEATKIRPYCILKSALERSQASVISIG